jgi:hypothetical protein
LLFATYSQFLVESWDTLSPGAINGRKPYLEVFEEASLVAVHLLSRLDIMSWENLSVKLSL